MAYLERIQKVWFTPTVLLCWLPPTVLGAILRFWSLGFGLPNHFRPDEDMVVLPSLGMVGGNLDPHDYTYPTLYKYILVLIYRVCMALGLGAQGYETAWQYAAYGFFVDGSFFFLVARGVSAVFGVLTIVALYRVGELAYGRWVGSVGAWLLAVSVLHVRDSHFGVTDITSVAFLMFGLVYCVQIAKRGALKDYVLAGVLIGLATAAKYGAVLGLVPLSVAHLTRCPEGVPLFKRWFWDRRIWFAGVLCVFTLLLLSPYHVLNVKDFAGDFGFQMRHVFEYGHGEDLGSGWLYHPRVTLRYGLGILVLLGSLAGLVVMGLRRRPVDWVLLSLFVAFFIVIGQGRVVFFRYALPLVPLCCVFCAVLLDRVRHLDVVPKQYVRAVGIGLVVLCVVEPLWASVRLNVLLGAEDTRSLARDWIEENIPEGVKVANVGGLYGDVQVRNRRGVGWWFVRFFRGFGAVSEPDLVNFLTQFETELSPYYLYHYNVGNKIPSEEDEDAVTILDDQDLAVFVTHEHPLQYSQVNATLLSKLQKRAFVWAEFSPKGDLDVAVFDPQDAFYYPLGRFGDVERGGPVVKIWRIRDRTGVAVANPGASKTLIYDAFFWLGSGSLHRKNYDEALAYYRRAMRTNPLVPDVRIFITIALLQQNRYSEAATEMQRALSVGADIELWERAMFLVADLDLTSYAQMGILCEMMGNEKEATSLYGRAKRMGHETVDVLERALAISPQNVGVQRNLKMALKKMKAN